jgi:alkyl hydroperoxide reductase subunit F
MSKASIIPYDSIIIGAGPAGITAAVYLARKKLDILVLTLDLGGLARFSTDVENYTGFTMIRGEELVRRFEEHLNAFNIKIVYEKVKAISKDGELFKVETENNLYWAKTIIIASGRKAKKLNVEGEEKFIGKGLTYLAIYDAPSFKDKNVVVVGGGNSALEVAIEVAKFAKQVYIINLFPELTGDEILQESVKKLSSVKIFNNCKIVKISGEKKVEGVEVLNVQTNEIFNLDVSGVIVEIGLEPNIEFILPEELKLNENNEIEIDKNCNTNIPGLFAAGDVTDVKWKHIIIAAGEGAKAALSAYEYLKKNFSMN